MADLIVLTCASGKQCNQLVPLLAQQSSKYEIRLIVKSEQSLHRLQEQWPKADVQQERLDNPEDCSRILKSATTLYYVSPPEPYLTAQRNPIRHQYHRRGCRESISHEFQIKALRLQLRLAPRS